MQCCGVFTTGWTRTSTKIDKTHKIHAPKIQGVFLSEGAKPPEAITTSRTARGDLKTGTNVNYELTVSTFFKNVDFSKISRLKSGNVPGNVFRISKNPDMGESQKSGKSRFGAPHSYRHSWVTYIYIYIYILIYIVYMGPCCCIWIL